MGSYGFVGLPIVRYHSHIFTAADEECSRLILWISSGRVPHFVSEFRVGRSLLKKYWLNKGKKQ